MAPIVTRITRSHTNGTKANGTKKKEIKSLDELVNKPGMEFVKSFLNNRKFIFSHGSYKVREILKKKSAANLTILNHHIYNDALRLCGRDIIKYRNQKTTNISQIINGIIINGPYSYAATEYKSLRFGTSLTVTPITVATKTHEVSTTDGNGRDAADGASAGTSGVSVRPESAPKNDKPTFGNLGDIMQTVTHLSEQVNTLKEQMAKQNTTHREDLIKYKDANAEKEGNSKKWMR